METQTKKCSMCKLEQNLTEFHKDKTTKSGYSFSCKVCKSRARKTHKVKEKVVKVIETTNEVRVCSTCNHEVSFQFPKNRRTVADHEVLCEECEKFVRICVNCDKTLTRNDFYKDKTQNSGLDSACKNCKSEKSKNYRSSNGFWMHMAQRCKWSAGNRSKPGKRALECTLVASDYEKLFKDQKGLCFSSKLPMNKAAGVDWQVSAERLDESLGYVHENVVLVCLEFNGQYQNNLGLLLEVCKTSLQQHPPADKQLFVKKVPKPQKRIQISKDEFQCVECGVTKNQVEFGSRGACRKCKNGIPCTYMRMKVSAAKQTAKTRSYSGVFSITTETVIAQYFAQRGLCFYTGVPMRFKGRKFMLSIERINPKLNYSPDNIVLIIGEFNVARTGSFTKDKFLLLRNHLQKLYPNLEKDTETDESVEEDSEKDDSDEDIENTEREDTNDTDTETDKDEDTESETEELEDEESEANDDEDTESETEELEDEESEADTMKILKVKQKN